MTTVYTGARIHGSPATSLAVTDGVITWLGHEFPGTATSTIDLAGAYLAPAFVDAHVHITSAGLMRTGLDLTATGSLADLLDALRDRVRAAPDLPVWGHGWDETRWPEHRLPTRAELDAVAGNAAVYLSRVDVHSALASTALVDRAPGVRTAAGWSATGPLRRDAHHHVRRAARELITPEQRRAAQVAFLEHAASRGVARVHECGGPEISGEDDFREVVSHPQVVGYWGAMGEIPPGARGLAGDLFVDGALGSRTAALTEPYTDQPDTVGARYLDAEQIAGHLVACTDAGVQAGFHVIGDAAVAEVVAGFQRAEKVVGEQALGEIRHRLEHLEMITEAQAAELARFRVIASVQPRFDAYWGGRDGMYAERLGPERGGGLNPFAMLLGAGLTLAFGSDAPVTPVDPWATIHAATHHRTPSSAISAEASFTAHTQGGWLAAGPERPEGGLCSVSRYKGHLRNAQRYKGHLQGVLAVGAAATFAVWRGETCLRTVLDGTTIYEVSDGTP